MKTLLEGNDDEYPDEELLLLIVNEIVDVIGFVLALEMSLLSCTEVGKIFFTC